MFIYTNQMFMHGTDVDIISQFSPVRN